MSTRKMLEIQERALADAREKYQVKRIPAAQQMAAILWPDKVMGDALAVFWSTLDLSHKHQAFACVQRIEKALDAEIADRS